MNEPKKRGRPAKATKLAETLAAFVSAEGIVDPASTPFAEAARARASMIDAPEMVNLAPKREMLDPTSDIDTFDRPPFVAERVTPSQAYAMRVWSGQSVSLPRNERIKRVMAALEGQNLPTDGVELP